jgi:hypothetical protein
VIPSEGILTVATGAARATDTEVGAATARAAGDICERGAARIERAAATTAAERGRGHGECISGESDAAGTTVGDRGGFTPEKSDLTVGRDGPHTAGAGATGSGVLQGRCGSDVATHKLGVASALLPAGTGVWERSGLHARFGPFGSGATEPTTTTGGDELTE